MNRERVYLWGAVVGLVLFVVWVWSQFNNDPNDAGWTDPNQPPPMVPPMFGPVCGRQQRATPRSKCYPPSLSGWDESCVGDV